MLLQDDKGMLIKRNSTNLFNIENRLILIGGFYINSLLNNKQSYANKNVE